MLTSKRGTSGEKRRKVVRPSMKISPLTVFFGLWHKRQFWSASLLQFSCINQTVLHFFLPLPPPLPSMPLSHFEIRENFGSFLYRSTLLFISLKASSHLASSSGRNFVVRSLNYENSEAAYYLMLHISPESVILLLCFGFGFFSFPRRACFTNIFEFASQRVNIHWKDKPHLSSFIF